MLSKNECSRTYWHIQLAGISLCLFLAGCAAAPPPAALHYDVPCLPADAKNQLRQYFSTQRIRTSETASDNKSFAITTDLISEPRSGKIDRQASYKLDIKPAENANTATIDLSRVSIKAKGVRERDWRDEEDLRAAPHSEEQISKAVQSICRSGQ